MRMSILAIVVAVACSFGCERKPSPKVEPDRPRVDVKAPGVDVKVDPKGGVEVKAPGVNVETVPKDKT